MIREEVQQRLTMALAVADDPATVFCVHPFTAVEGDGGEQLGKLLARVIADPDHALLLSTGTAFVFVFVDGLGSTEGNRTPDSGSIAACS